VASGKPSIAKPAVVKSNAAPMVLHGQATKDTASVPHKVATTAKKAALTRQKTFPTHQKMLAPAEGTPVKPSDGFTVVVKKQKKVKAPPADQFVMVSKKAAPPKLATKPLPQLRGVQLANYVSPKHTTSWPLQNAKASSLHYKNEFPKLAKSSATILEEPTKSLVRFRKPSHNPTETEKAILASAT
jgi:hypothetical protein